MNWARAAILVPALTGILVAAVGLVVRWGSLRLLKRRAARGTVLQVVRVPSLLWCLVAGAYGGLEAAEISARLGEARDPAAVTSRGPRRAHLNGFDLHADVWVSANDRAGVERLCRYVLRPPFAQERLRLRSDGRVALELKMAWRDGAREPVFEPLEFLERLAAITPRPDTNLLICHSVLAPRARWYAGPTRCGSGSWGGQRLRMAPCVRWPGPTDGATTARRG